MKTIKCVCEQQGLLILGKNYDRDKDDSVPCYEYWVAHYELENHNLLFGIAAGYSKVQRANGKIENGYKYTLRKAKNDFELLAVERDVKTDVAGIEYTE